MLVGMTHASIHRGFTRTSLLSGRTTGSLFLLLPLVVVMLAAVILVGVAGYENFRFARGLDQCLNLISVAKRYADVQPGFAQQSGEDILANLARNGQITAQTSEGHAARIVNPWGGDMHAVVTEPSVLRIDAVVPAHVCRRLGMYLTKLARDFALVEFAARDGDAPYRLAYNGNLAKTIGEEDMTQICGDAKTATVVAAFRLR